MVQAANEMTIVFNPGQVLELLEEGADPNVRDEVSMKPGPA